MIAGVGLHSGAGCRVHLHLDQGEIRFRRGGRYLPARLDHVVSSERSTVLGQDGLKVATVEHLLGALHVLGWWRGLVIEVSGDELPILDGSAAPWLEPLSDLGPPPAPPAPYLPRRSRSLRQGDSALTLTTGPTELCVEIEFMHPAIGRQRWCGAPERYREVLDARTFGFLDEVESLRERGLAAGAGLENAIVFSGEEPLQALRHHDEPVRHKALDALGDFFLLGRPLAGRLQVVKGSHAAHIAFMKRLGELTVRNSSS